MAERNYAEKDLEEALRKTFTDDGFQSILIDGNETRSEFKGILVNYGLDKDWLELEEEAKDLKNFRLTYILTDEGKTHFGLDR